MSKESLSRREFLKLGGVILVSRLVPDCLREVKPFPFINQKNQSQCAIASMTMLIASFKQRENKPDVNVENIYDQVLQQAIKTTKRDLTKPSSNGVYGNEIIQILNSIGQQQGWIAKDNRRKASPEVVEQQLLAYGPAIVDINVDYKPIKKDYSLNHWVVVTNLERKGGTRVIIADPFRTQSKVPFLPFSPTLPEGVQFYDGDNRLIIAEWTTFTSSAGGVFIQLQRTYKRTTPSI